MNLWVNPTVVKRHGAMPVKSIAPAKSAICGLITIATTTTATTATATEVAAWTAVTAATRTLFFRAGDVDRQLALAERCAVQGCNRLLASSGVDIVTNAKPRERPLIRSIMRLTSTTVPWAANASCRSFSVVLKERFPTNNLLFIDDLLFKTNHFFQTVPDHRVSNHH